MRVFSRRWTKKKFLETSAVIFVPWVCLSVESWLIEKFSRLNPTTVETAPRPFYNRLHDISCQRLMQSTPEKILDAEIPEVRQLPDEEWVFRFNVKECRALDPFFWTEKPVMRPVAFAILVSMDLDHFIYQMHTLYAPNHLYCVHIDRKATTAFKQGVKWLVHCINMFANKTIVHTISDYNIIRQGKFHIDATLHCMDELLGMSNDWLHVLNIEEGDFPLRTPSEISKVSEYYGQKSMAHFQVPVDYFRADGNIGYEYDENGLAIGISIVEGDVCKKMQVPYNLTVVKGLTESMLSREFVEYLLRSKVSASLREYLQFCFHSPHESYWNTLLFNSACNRLPDRQESFPTALAHSLRYTVRQDLQSGWHCPSGRWRHKICMFTAVDLPRLVGVRTMFVNKIRESPLTRHCLHEWVVRRFHHLRMPFSDPMALFVHYFRGPVAGLVKKDEKHVLQCEEVEEKEAVGRRDFRGGLRGLDPPDF